MYWFTADEHYGHSNALKYCKRPFEDVNEMDNTIIRNHNEVVSQEDTVIHAGDFTLAKKQTAYEYINKLNGNHIFLNGSHDKWLKGNKNINQIWEKYFDKQMIVVCHYALKVWPCSHYNSYLLYGHSHGKLEPEGKSWDIGVDNNNFYPVSLEKIKEIMDTRPDNFNFLYKEKG